MSGLTITNGLDSGALTSGMGAASITKVQSTVSISDCNFTNNHAYSWRRLGHNYGPAN